MRLQLPPDPHPIEVIVGVLLGIIMLVVLFTVLIAWPPFGWFVFLGGGGYLSVMFLYNKYRNINAAEKALEQWAKEFEDQ